jgi:hypothetical protein
MTGRAAATHDGSFASESTGIASSNRGGSDNKQTQRDDGQQGQAFDGM